MIPVLVSQNVEHTSHGTRCDTLDQRWHLFLRVCDLLPVPVPNDPRAAKRLLETVPAAGLVLTGGNDLGAYGGTAPERDAAELLLLRECVGHAIPVLGVCRGMQLLQHHFQVPLVQVSGHVIAHQVVEVGGAPRETNSYHRWGATGTTGELDVWARTPDGVVKAVRHDTQHLLGIMWHPERLTPFAAEDIELFRHHFEVA
ncbi:gamma-glutamyl-gamma-aminobutyrate hydrolase family protein [Streptomyces sp. NPDC050619]|uniref:gamma-glutamyl-gamma-aminobutyrate hydrolase family protein n=1 Tax=Streptomyces sp. NPDC050619 TaxID=3157214 RepID=UPI003412284A